MKKISLLLFILINFVSFSQEFYTNSRVKAAYAEKIDFITTVLASKGIDNLEINILIIGLKDEKDLQVWVKQKNASVYEHLITYKFCRLSGTLGPKRKYGDGQVPEGFYHINVFNPQSSYLLSLGINYPNKSDKILGYKPNLGYDIYMHGGCATIGCIPITDDKIKELYILAILAKKAGQNKIPVYIFPMALSEKNMKKLKYHYGDLKNIKFWQNLKLGYDFFVNNRKELNFWVNEHGEYVF